MKTTTLATLIVLTLPGVLFAQDPEAPESKPALEWQELREERGNCILWVPGKAKPSDTMIDTAAGKIKMYQYVVDMGQSVYMLSYCDYPDAVIESAKAEEILDNAKNGAANNTKGKIVSSKTTKVCGYPALEFSVENPRFKIYQRITLVKNRLYQVLAIYPKDGVKTDVMRKVLDSFKLLDEMKLN